MSNETQPPVEDALKAYAAERRRALGTPPAMPDHVRSRLHREIRRVSTAAAVGPSRPAWWTWCLRPWAWGLAASLLAGIWITWQVLGPRPGEVRLVAARPEPAPARGGELRPEAAPVASTATAASGAMVDSAAEPGLPAQFTRAQVTKTQAPVPVAPEVVTLAMPPAGTRVAERGNRTEPVEERGGTGFATPPAVTQEAVSEPARGADAYSMTRATKAAGPATTVVAGFRDTATLSQLQQRFTQNRPAPMTPVLNSFQIDQVGRQLRLVDADGSVYLATLGTANPGAQSQAGLPVQAASPSVGRAAPSQLRTRAVMPDAADALRNQTPSMQVLTLNAMGTNRQLRQQVVFTGNLLVTNLAGVPVVEESVGLGTNVESLNQLFSNSSVHGLVTVGGTNQYPVEAVPTPP